MKTNKGSDKKEGLNITEIELDDNGNPVRFKGTYKKPSKKVPNNKIFSPNTNKIIFWSELELDYIGG